MEPLTFGSLFAGIGGFDLGFERAGMTCKWQVEIDDYANRVLAKHWPDVRRHGDIRTFPPGPADDWRVDVICGGFPCQDISYAGRGAGIEGERSGLFFELARVVSVLGPRVVVLENVPALLHRGMREVLGTLASLGFDAEWEIVSACEFGAPHTRERVFCVAHSDQERWDWPGRDTYREHALRGGREWEAAAIGPTRSDVEHWAVSVLEGDDGFVPAAERSRMDAGVSDWMDRIGCCGNAVSPVIAEWIGRRIVEAMQVTQEAAAAAE